MDLLSALRNWVSCYLIKLINQPKPSTRNSACFTKQNLVYSNSTPLSSVQQVFWLRKTLKNIDHRLTITHRYNIITFYEIFLYPPANTSRVDQIVMRQKRSLKEYGSGNDPPPPRTGKDQTQPSETGRSNKGGVEMTADNSYILHLHIGHLGDALIQKVHLYMVRYNHG